MIRVRFKANPEDPRPISWPVKHPYWITPYSNKNAMVVSYADDLDEIYRLWPEAEKIDFKEVDKYVFTDRFEKPDWFDS